jgi:hypothetical protein
MKARFILVCAVALGLTWALPVFASSSASVIPPLHGTAGVTIQWREATHTAHTEAVFWRFRTAKRFRGDESGGVSQVFEQQLSAAGWHELEADTSNNVFVSAWDRRDAQDRLVQMVFAIRQLDNPQEYFASIQVILP